MHFQILHDPILSLFMQNLLLREKAHRAEFALDIKTQFLDILQCIQKLRVLDIAIKIAVQCLFCGE